MEDYVTFEQAQRLRELGFDWECNHYYDIKTKEFLPVDWFDYDGDVDADDLYDSNPPKGIISYRVSAPTMSQAQKWLREVKGIAVCVQSFDSNKDPRYGNFWWKEYFLPNCEERGPQWVEWWISGQHPIFPKYEEALSDGISKMIELIINK